MSALIVPVDVMAYCVGTLDAQGPARSFVGATTDFTNQTTANRPAFLGVNVTRDATQPPLWPLEAGGAQPHHAQAVIQRGAEHEGDEDAWQLHR